MHTNEKSAITIFHQNYNHLLHYMLVSLWTVLINWQSGDCIDLHTWDSGNNPVQHSLTCRYNRFDKVVLALDKLSSWFMRKAFINWCSRRRRERGETDNVAETYSKSRVWKKTKCIPWQKRTSMTVSLYQSPRGSANVNSVMIGFVITSHFTSQNWHHTHTQTHTEW